MEELNKLTELLGIDLGVLLVCTPIVIAFVNWAKTKLELKGKWNLLVGFILSFALVLLIYLPNIQAVIVNGILLWGLSVGVWDSAKIVAHKAGNNK